MRRYSTAGGAMTVLLALLWSSSGVAQGNCGNIQFTTDISSRFPNAANACLDVVQREGKDYAHFQARIVSVSGSRVEAEFKLPNGEYGRTVAFTPPGNSRVRIGGSTYRYSDLSRGQELDVYLPPDRWELVSEVPLTEPTETFAALPSTASSLPWLAVFGVAFLGIGVLAAGIAFGGNRHKN